MLKTITIRNFAIVDELSVTLDDGMTVLTGETGAGKSILLDALNLALGDRADNDSIRHGCERAEVTVEFELEKHSPALNWLQEQSMDDDTGCLIRRIMSREGRSKGFINGSPVPMQSLKELGEMLVDIHGQHEHQSLLKRDVQRQLLDDYADNAAHLKKLQTAYKQWHTLQNRLQQLQTSYEERQARRELLNYQVEELQNLDLQSDEMAQLPEELTRLANAEKLRQTIQTSVNELYDADHSMYQQLGTHSRELDALLEFDPNLKSNIDMLNEASIQIQEACQDLRHYADTIEPDPQRLSEIEERLGMIHELARKHHVSPEALPELGRELADELQQLGDDEQNLESLQTELDDTYADYQKIANTLSKRRATAAAQLNKQVTATIKELGMPSISFEIQLQPAKDKEMTPYGQESIEFMISPNPGQPLKPLRKIASGGELSRISLAIQTVLADSTHIPTLIYDEVDAGIGGPTAEVVGRKLRTLGENRQVLCVTHLAQVASQAHHHLKVYKHALKDRTTSSVQALDTEQRVEETARMLGGIEITRQSLSHAKEMINQVATKKKGKKTSKAKA